MKTPCRTAFTLVELVLVLVILAALTAMIMPLLGGFEISTPTGDKSPEQVVTEATMNTIRDAVMGTPSSSGMWADMGQRPDLFPQNPDFLLFEFAYVVATPQYSGVREFDPVSKTGWRGPYLVGHSNVIDAWGNDILIQVDFDDSKVVDSGEAMYARLVSAGPNEIYETTLAAGIVPGDGVPANELSLAECGDDIVVFFRVADTRE